MTQAIRDFAITVQPALQTGFSASAGSGSIVGNVWTPAKDANGIITQASVNTLTAGNFYKVASSDLFTPINNQLNAEFRNTLGTLASSPYTYSGAAGDGATGRMWCYGGGHVDGGNNGIYRFDVFYGTWAIEAYPTASWFRGASASDLYFYNRKPNGPCYLGYANLSDYAANGRPVPKMYAYDRSSTGFACMIDNTYKTLMWVEAPGPDNTPIPDQATYNIIKANPTLGFGTVGFIGYNVMADGIQCTTHSYYSMCFGAKANILANCGYNFSFARLDGTGWARFDDVKYPTQWLANIMVGYGASNRIEQAWTLEDEVTGKFYSFGYGSEGAGVGYFWANACLVYDPTIPGVGGSGSMLFGPSFVTGGLRMDYPGMYWRAGRRFGWFDPVAGKSTQFTNFDNTQYKRLNVVFSGAGAPITAENANEGKAFVYIPHLGKLWGFRFASPGFAVTEYDIDAITPMGGVDWSLPARDITANFTNTSLFTELGSGNIYTRLQYFPGGKVLVAHIDTTLPALYCRIN